jgi:hypothetical protein
VDLVQLDQGGASHGLPHRADGVAMARPLRGAAPGGVNDLVELALVQVVEPAVGRGPIVAGA